LGGVPQIAEDLVEIGLERTAFALRLLQVVLEDFIDLLGLLEPRLKLTLTDTRLVSLGLDAGADLPELALCRIGSPAGER